MRVLPDELESVLFTNNLAKQRELYKNSLFVYFLQTFQSAVAPLYCGTDLCARKIYNYLKVCKAKPLNNS